MKIELYKQEIEKQASLVSAIGSVASKALPAVAKGAKAFSSMSMPKRALIGAGANAAFKGITYKAQPGEDGIKGRLGAMAGGAASGAIMGSMASKSNISNLGSKISGTGDKIFNAGAGMASEKASNIVGNIGIGINDAGNKIKNYFGN